MRGSIPHDPESFFRQRPVQRGNVRPIPRLNRADGVNNAHIGTTEDAIVHDVLDARARTRDHAAKLRQTTRPITDDRCEAGEPAVMHESHFDDATEDGGIDVSASHHQGDAFSGESRQFPGDHRGEWNSRGAFNDGFFELEHPENGERNCVFAD
jgi:hypothetical protein